MTVIVHLSDTHFGTQVPAVVRAVERAVLAIAPDIVTISGDITQRALPRQFLAAKQFLDALPAELKFVIPGNHDIPLINIPLRLIDPYRHYRAVFGLREGVWCHDHIGIIGYDATSRWRHTRGHLLEDDLVQHIRFARSQLKPGALLVACAHQPLVVGLPQDQENVLIDAGHVAELFAQNGVDLVLSGHVHWPIVTTTHDAFPALSRHFVLSGAGTAVSSRIRPGAPNSFNVIRMVVENSVPSIAITIMDYDATADQFGARMETTFGLADNGWQMTHTTPAPPSPVERVINYGSPRY